MASKNTFPTCLSVIQAFTCLCVVLEAVQASPLPQYTTSNSSVSSNVRNVSTSLTYPTVLPHHANAELAAQVPAAGTSNPLCSLTGHTYSQVFLSMELVCNTKKHYSKTHGYISITLPGDNSLPRRFEQQDTWQTQLGNIVAVMADEKNLGHLEETLKLEKIVNPAASNVFPYLLEEIANRTAVVNHMLSTLVSASEGVNVDTIVHDERPQHPEDQWPVPRELTESKEEYIYLLKEYNYGVMYSSCRTYKTLHDTMLLALDAHCAPAETGATETPVTSN
ncbi:uncharacterized protein LOC135809877 [Sycon ciliatum]|uniref:uncharacterized protein LOC135809877 n=1 Tax=Sycon ciliatum TaxID=27933 RepID=UPI0031F6ABB4|eukprot:scpid33718/ scgid10156/ 